MATQPLFKAKNQPPERECDPRAGFPLLLRRGPGAQIHRDVPGGRVLRYSDTREPPPVEGTAAG